MNIISIVKILYVYKVVLYFKLLRNTKIIHVQNEYIDIFTGFFTIIHWFKLHFRTNRKTHNKKRQIKYQIDIIPYVTHIEIHG